MKILKFGGTSVGSPQKIKDVAQLVNDGEEKLVVLSAMSGTTNKLVEISIQTSGKNFAKAKEILSEQINKYKSVVNELYKTDEYKKKAQAVVDENFNLVASLIKEGFTIKDERNILARGELISTALMYYHLQEEGIKSVLLPALEFMRIDEDKQPDIEYSSVKLSAMLKKHDHKSLFITQGYICLNSENEVDNLRRGGSDYTASLIGAAIKAEEIQIWTDIDGFHNNDPRFVENTKPIAKLSFDEAAELAYFGAKILHPATINPAQKANIPVRLKNTMNPSDFGTIITKNTEGSGIKAVAAKDGITVIKIKSHRMLLVYGFLRKVFEVFEKYKTPIDMITTSEVAVSLTIDDDSNLEIISKELGQFSDVVIEKKQTIVCVVGNFIAETKGLAAKVFTTMKDIPVRMISYGGSDHNISFLIAEEDKSKALVALNKGLF